MKAKIFFMIYTTSSVNIDGREDINYQIFAILIYC